MGKAFNICWQVQTAAAAFLRTANVGLASEQIYSGLEAQDLKLPRIVCQCMRANIDLSYGDNWLGDLSIIVRSQADDTTPDQHAELSALVFSKFRTDQIEQQLSDSAADFQAIQVLPKQQEWGIAGDEVTTRTWFSRLTLAVRCCSVDLTVDT